MTANIIKTDIPGEFSINLNTQPHNIRFVGATAPHILSFQVIHFPRKLILELLSAQHHGESVENLRGYLRIVSKVQGVDVAFQVDYTTVKSISKKVKQSTEHSQRFPVLNHSALTAKDRKEIFRIASPFLNRLEKSATQRLDALKYPQTVEECAAMLTSDQREKAVKLLYEAFIA